MGDTDSCFQNTSDDESDYDSDEVNRGMSSSRFSTYTTTTNKLNNHRRKKMEKEEKKQRLLDVMKNEEENLIKVPFASTGGLISCYQESLSIDEENRHAGSLPTAQREVLAVVGHILLTQIQSAYQNLQISRQAEVMLQFITMEKLREEVMYSKSAHMHAIDVDDLFNLITGGDTDSKDGVVTSSGDKSTLPTKSKKQKKKEKQREKEREKMERERLAELEREKIREAEEEKERELQ